jgi:arginyl-tRNA synthetase
MGKVFPDLAAKTEHIGHGMMRLPTGKMSSRTGDVITAESMIEDVQQRVEEKMKESPVPESARPRIAEQVAIGAIKYSILRQAPGKDIIFDLESALSFEGDSGPYLQYAHARTAQLLEKGKAKGISPHMAHIEHGELSRFLARFPDVVLRAEEERAPQYVSTYLIDLARLFNAFYAEHIIVDETMRDVSSGRLALTQAVRRTLASGLWMLGIAAPDMM